MLIYAMAAVSALVSAGVCLCTDAFLSYMWLWLLPLCFVGSFLGLAVLVFAALMILCALSDPDKPQENDSRLYRWVANMCADTVLTFARVRVHTRGLEKTPTDGRFLLVCNHLHEADPVVLLHFFRKSQLAFISKRENRDMFIVGKIMPRMMCQLVNRENDREALKTILKCIQMLKDDKVSVAVFPEGYINKDRKFHHFRPGVFKIAQKANVPIVVCTIRDTQYIIKNFLNFKPSHIDLHLLDVIPAEELKGKTTVEIADRIHAMMAEDLGEEYRPAEEENT